MSRLWTALFALFTAAACFAQPPQQPASALDAVRQAEVAIAAGFHAEHAPGTTLEARDHAVAEAWRTFVAQLDEAGRSATSQQAEVALATEGTSIEAKLLAIAVEKRQHPGPFAEIHDRYVRAQPRASRSQNAPPPAIEHRTEAYRHAWEMYLLAPRPVDAGGGYLLSAFDAVAAIGNPASAITLSQVIRTTVQPEVAATSAAAVRQRLALTALVEMPSAAAADALLESIDLLDRQPKREGGDVVEARAYVEHLFAVMAVPKALTWRSVLVVVAQKRSDAAPLLRALDSKLGSLR